MSEIFEFNGVSIYSSPKGQALFSSLGSNVDVYFPSRKRSRISAPFVFSKNGFEKKQKQPSIEALPDECLFEIFRRLPTDQEKSACACVSKRWLMLLSDIQRDEFCSYQMMKASSPDDNSLLNEDDDNSKMNRDGFAVSRGNDLTSKIEDMEIESDGHLSRSLEGKKATDIRLSSIAVGTAGRGGLGKLSIRGNNPTRGVTNLGLKAIARGCPSLRVLSLWNVPSIGDEGIFEIGNGCHQLEKLDLCRCPAISDKALLAIAKNCPNLTDLTIESCPNIGNEGLQAVSRYCPNLKSVMIKNCPLVRDQGIVSLLSSASYALTKLKLHGLNITDVSLAVIGHYGRVITDLVLTNLQNVSERGFWVMANGHGLQKLKILMITSCQGVTDVVLKALGKGCPNLKQISLLKSSFLSDNGLVSFIKSAGTLEVLQLEECHRITQYGVVAALASCGMNLKSLALVNCLGIRDVALQLPPLTPCKSLRSLSIRSCPGFCNATLAMLGKLCTQLQSLELSGLHGITDAGLLPLVESCESGLLRVNLSHCMNITDVAVSSLAKSHGGTLDLLNLDGCGKITDSSLISIAENCLLLSDLDISECAITDSGIAALACAKELGLQILSVSGCSLVTDKSLFFLEKLGQTLSGLNLQHCNGISSSKINLLVEQLWRCDVLT